MSAKTSKTKVAAAVAAVIAPAPAAAPVAIVAPVVVEGLLLPTEAGAFQSYGERVGKGEKEMAAIVRMIVHNMSGKTWEQTMEDKENFVVGYAIERKGERKAGARFWERNVRAMAVELGTYPESTKSSAKREPSEAQAKLEALSDGDAKFALGEAAKAGDVANMAKYAGLLAKREKAANAEANKAKTEARAKAWKPLKETLDAFETEELLLVRNFCRIVVETRGNAKRRATIAKALSGK